MTTFCGNDFYQSAELSPLLPLLVLLYYYGVFFNSSFCIKSYACIGLVFVKKIKKRRKKKRLGKVISVSHISHVALMPNVNELIVVMS